MKKSYLLLLLVAINVHSVNAYIDPGTAGIIVGGGIWPFLLAILAAVGGFFIKFFFKPIKKGVKKAWGKIKRKD